VGNGPALRDTPAITDVLTSVWGVATMVVPPSTRIQEVLSGVYMVSVGRAMVRQPEPLSRLQV
jgi:hypothetical protein